MVMDLIMDCCKEKFMNIQSSPLVYPNNETVSYSLPRYEDWENALTKGIHTWMYLTDGNPTNDQLEKEIARMQGRDAAWVTSAGKSAISATLLALLNSGDHFILLREGYKSTRHFSEKVLERFGIAHTLLGIDQLDDLDQYIIPHRTKLIVLESPTNPMTRVVDIKKISDHAHNAGMLVILDNSLAGLHQHGNLDVDIFVHSLSKFTSGCGDVMGGAIISSSDLVRKIRNAHVWNAETMATQVAHTHLKGLQTYSLRLERQVSSAFEIARRLESHPATGRVYYPGLASHPDHHIAVSQMKDFGTIIAFDLERGEKILPVCINSLQKFKIAFGAGFTQSLVNPAWLFYARSFPEIQEGKSAIRMSTIRLSIGVEPLEELWSDLEQGLSKCM
jgi:cystathionine beta-lyase/cystathionine gamma-synthase